MNHQSPIINYLFILGRESDLCYYELETLLKCFDDGADIKKLSSDCALVQFNKLDPAWWIDCLGGTRLIAEVIGSVASLNAKSLDSLIDNNIREIAISSSDIPAPERMKILLELKKLRKGLRYRLTNESYLVSGLSERLIRRPDSSELLIVRDPTPGVGYKVGKVVAVQNAREWTERDRGLPAPDPTAGMLPPKLARIMVNLAEPARQSRISTCLAGRQANELRITNQSSITNLPRWQAGHKSLIVLDPFCGSGQIPIEALRLGWHVIASDIDQKAVNRTKINLLWATNKYHQSQIINHKSSIIQSSVQDLLEHIPLNAIAAIVTEPDLGPPLRQESETPSKSVLNNIAQMISLTFEASKKLLKSGGRIIIIIPIIDNNRIYDRFDKNALSGYILQAKFIYARPDARVKRELFVFDKV